MQAILQKKKSAHTSALTADAAAFSTYLDSINDRIQGKWRNAGDKLMRCAEAYLRLQMPAEAAMVFCEAAETYIKDDKSEALRAYSLAVKVYCDVNKYDIAGKIECTIASIHDRIKNYEEAAFHYRKAANFLSGQVLLEKSDFCLERSAEALIRIGECNQSHLMYENLAISALKTNLRRTMVKGYLLRAILCLFGVYIDLPLEVVVSHQNNAFKDKMETQSMTSAGDSTVASMVSSQDSLLAEKIQARQVSKAVAALQAVKRKAAANNKRDMIDPRESYYYTKYIEIEQKIREYEELDFLWRGSNERLFLLNILHCRRQVELDNFTDHLYYWQQYHPFKDIDLVMLKVVLDEIEMLRPPDIIEEFDPVLSETTSKA